MQIYFLMGLTVNVANVSLCQWRVTTSLSSDSAFCSHLLGTLYQVQARAGSDDSLHALHRGRGAAARWMGRAGRAGGASALT